jgi:hypothetical protein
VCVLILAQGAETATHTGKIKPHIERCGNADAHRRTPWCDAAVSSGLKHLKPRRSPMAPGILSARGSAIDLSNIGIAAAQTRNGSVNWFFRYRLLSRCPLLCGEWVSVAYSSTRSEASKCTGPCALPGFCCCNALGLSSVLAIRSAVGKFTAWLDCYTST